MCTFTEQLLQLVSPLVGNSAENQDRPKGSSELRQTNARHPWLSQMLIVAHPFLLGLVPILHLYSKNMYEAYFSIAMIFVAASLAMTAVVFGAAWLWLRNASRAAVLVTVFNALFYTYGRVFDFLMKHEPVTLSYRTWHIVLLLLATAMLIATGMYVARARVDYRPLSRFLSCMLAVLLLFSVIKIAHHHARLVLAYRDQLAVASAESAPHYNRVAPVTAETPQLPDVYYIILDGYARADTLQRVCGYDNSPFLDFLRSRGFYVANQSCSNYPMTYMSLASSLNMRYLDDLLPPLEKYPNDGPIYGLFEWASVPQLFQAKGYRFVCFANNFKSTWSHADLLLRLRPAWLQGEFAEVLLRSTALRLFEPKISDQHLFELENLKNVPDIAGPKFTYCHIIAPHPPYVFDRHGNVKINVPQSMLRKECYERLDNDNPAERQEYVDQLAYVNIRIEEAVDSILARSAKPPMIIIQGDHGSFFTLPKEFTNENLDEFAQERMPILNAYLVPEKMREKLRPDISPVNTFRLLFNECFGEQFELLPEKHMVGWYDDRYNLQDVTAVVHPLAANQHETLVEKAHAVTDR